MFSLNGCVNTRALTHHLRGPGARHATLPSLTNSCWQDRVISFWEVTKGQLEDACAEGRQKDREADHQVEVHQVELKVCTWPVRLPPRSLLSAVSTRGTPLVAAAADKNHRPTAYACCVSEPVHVPVN